MSVARVKTEDNGAFERRLEKHLAEISGKYLDRAFSGFCTHFRTYLTLDGREDKSLVAVGSGISHKLTAGIVSLDVLAEDDIRSCDLIKSK